MPTLIRVPTALPALIRRERVIQAGIIQAAVRAVGNTVLMQVISVEHLTLLADAFGFVERVLG